MAKCVGRGALVVVEGLDKTGKTTQCSKLIDKLVTDGRKAMPMNFPDRTTQIGKVINDYLQKKLELDDHAVHLLFSANRWEAVSRMKALLHDGVTLIVDRYAFSGVVFSAAKKGMQLEWCIHSDVGLPKPDAVIYLTRELKDAALSESYGEERYENVKFQKHVAEMYNQLKTSDWRVVNIDGRSIDDVHNELHSHVLSVIKDVCDKDIEKLWTQFEIPTNPTSQTT